MIVNYAALSQRSCLKRSTIAGASPSVFTIVFTIVRPELVRGLGEEQLKAGLVGCGGRGTETSVNCPDIFGERERVPISVMSAG